MKKIALPFLLVAFACSLSAQTVTLPRDTSWKRGGFSSLQFNQVAFSNWAAGGENSISLNGVGFGFANFLKGKNYWNSFANLQFGLISSKYDRTARKNIDLIELQTKAGRELGDSKFYLSGLLNFRSQFANGYLYPNDSLVVSKFLAPGYITASIGVDWKPVTWFSLYVSPSTGKFTVVADQDIANILVNGASLWGTDPAVIDSATGQIITNGKTLRTEFGAYVVATLLKDVAKNVNVATKLQLFNNYTDKNESNRSAIDVIWDLNINLKVNDWLGVTAYGNLIYDQDIIIAEVDEEGVPTGVAGPRTQLREGFGIALTYKFGDEVPK
jgi:hypothetical protein